MCGIGGIWHPDGREASHGQLRRLVSAMRHRGPEGAAFARADRGSLLLGFLQLGFTDQVAGLQPMFNEDHTVALVFNGEIYDHEAFREELQAAGHVFRTRSDSEVLIHLYEEQGVDFLDRLNGEFAFVLWDGRRRRLLAVRDRFGIKPLFFARHRGAFVFASEAKGLLALEGFPAALSPAYFTGPGIGLADTALSPFDQIEALRPGHLLEVDREGQRIRPWWRPRFEKGATPGDPEIRARLREELDRAVARRVGGEVPIALALSSGVDSSIVAGLAARHRPDLTAFSLSYPAAGYDESAQAARTAHHHGLAFEGVPCPVEALAEGLRESIWFTEIATNSLSTVARMRLTAAVRRAGFKALTGGEAADEIFGGYPYFGIEAIWRARRQGGVRARLAAERARQRFHREESRARGVFWDEAVGGRAPQELFGYPSTYELRLKRMQRARGLLFSRAFLDRLGPFAGPRSGAEGEFDLDWLRSLHPFDATRMIARSVFGTFAVPALGDRVEMSASLEGRVPFLDRHVLELAYSLGQDHCIEPGTFRRKRIVKDSFADLLPPDHDAQPKHTWMAPTFRELAATPAGRELLETELADAALAAAGLFDVRSVKLLRGAWRRWPAGRRGFDAIDGLLGYVLSVQILHRSFVEDPGSVGHGPDLLPLDRDQDPTAYAQSRSS